MNACILLSALAIVAADEPWKPSENPDPAKILQEAQEDRRAERFEQALDKHVWYHRNALKHQPAQSGVRRSFALSYWKELADAYPPALFKLMEIREEAVTNVSAGQDLRQQFADLAAMNKYLGEEARTKDVFAMLHTQQPDAAKQVFALAQPALVKAKEYRLCGNYLDPDASSRRLIAMFHTTKRLAKNSPFAERQLDFSNKKFTNDAATLVALLVVNYRKPEAEKVAQDAKKEWEDAAFHKAVDEALKGNVPDPWP